MLEVEGIGEHLDKLLLTCQICRDSTCVGTSSRSQRASEVDIYLLAWMPCSGYSETANQYGAQACDRLEPFNAH